jgi:hypothetical protein
MTRYVVKEDYKIIPSGVILEEVDGVFKYEVETDGVNSSMTLDKETISDTRFFKKVEVEVTISDEDLDSVVEKNWKVVLNVKCTEKRLLDVKRTIENAVSKLFLET